MAVVSANAENPTSSPVLFFDREVGTALPQALNMLRLPTRVEYLQNHFPMDAQDDEWMPVVGTRGWVLIGHDKRRHRRSPELSDIQGYEMGCFYLGITYKS
jgi:hypothetical protein